MTMDKLISELLILPEQVRKGDFVLNLSKGVTEPEKTLEQYVVTPQLVDCFDDALGFIKSAVDAINSKACYLHGSFGAGKSHFMAVLHLLLAAQSPPCGRCPNWPRSLPSTRWVENKKFLLVPYHMIGARNMESAILGGYVDHVMELHPGAPLPGVYLADEIFKNASPAPAAARRREVLRGSEPGQTRRQAARAGASSPRAGMPPDSRRPWKPRPPAKSAPGWSATWSSSSSPPSGGSPRARTKPTSISTWGSVVISAHAKSLGYDGADPVPRRVDPLAGHALGRHLASSRPRGTSWPSWSSPASRIARSRSSASWPGSVTCGS